MCVNLISLVIETDIGIVFLMKVSILNLSIILGIGKTVFAVPLYISPTDPEYDKVDTFEDTQCRSDRQLNSGCLHNNIVVYG